ncbi:MAG: glucan biosynthesis protein [Microvirga sp.]
MSRTPPAGPGPSQRPIDEPPSRRDALRLIGGAALGALAPAPALAQAPVLSQIQSALGEGQRFEPAAVVELARALAKRPYAAVPADLPEALTNLNYEQYIGIRALPQAQIWAGEGRGFVVEPLHRGWVFSSPVLLFTVEDESVRRIAYERSRFEFGKLNVPANLGDIAYSGFRLFTTALTEPGGQPVEFALVQGASFFRALARGQSFGLVARALTLRPAEARGEEFPFFRAFWIERPRAGTNALVVHALIDSESASGAVRMTFRPGEMTIVDVETSLFPRVALEHVGLGGMGSSYLFGSIDRRGVDDPRPAVHKSSGVQMHNGSDEWIWRPLQNPETLQISVFLDKDPKGFGLIQRERDYAAFQDDEQRWERRPSLWIEPIGEWGQGAVQLIEIPSESEVNDNILAYWRPKAAMTAGAEVVFSYRQFWCWHPPDRPDVATVAATRVGRGSTGRRRRFLVDFTGEALGGAPIAELKAAVTTSPGTIQALRTWPYPERKTLRVAFELDPGNENACEMRLLLEAAGKPISETWLYRWTP